MSSRTVANQRAPDPSIDDLSDDSLAEGMPTPDSAAENKAPVKGAASRAKTAPAKTAVRHASGAKVASKATAAKPKPVGRRAPLKDTTNTHDGNDTEEVDDFAQSETDVAHNVAKMPARKAPAAKVTKKTASSRAKPAVSSRAIPETQPEPPADSEQPKPKRGKQPKSRAGHEEIAETQPDNMELDAVAVAENGDERDQPGPSTAHDDRAASTAKAWAHPPPRRRQGSASDAERLDDSTLRRQLSDMTRKFEALNVKYRSLEDVVTTEGEDNFAKLKRLTDQATKASEKLIASLRAELAAETSRSRELASVQAQLDKANATTEELAEENKSLASTLQQRQTELKTMHAKLAATRSGSATVHEQPGRGPASAGHSEVAKEAQKQLLKEDLYGDLTGLIVRDVKRRDEEEEDVFDCIQTGRNGTLRFYLTVQSPAPGSKPAADYSYDDAEFQYAPVLDASNDRDLISILPDYLTDEICFPRSQAAKFYSRIQDCMTKKFEIMDGGEE